jgi:hypothetical protein
MHVKATYKLNRSPILLVFHANPYIPECVPGGSVLVVNMPGHNALRKVVVQMKRRITTSREVKSKRALMIEVYLQMQLTPYLHL